MTAYSNTLVPGEILKFVDSWVRSAPIRELVEGFGGRIDSGPLPETLTALVEWAREQWDFRKGAERSDAPIVRFSSSTEDLVRQATEALGMRRSSAPEREGYDHVLILGGKLETCARRTAYAARLLETLTASTVTGLGTFRETDDVEIARGLEVGLGRCATEFAGMVAAFERSFAPAVPQLVYGGGDGGHVYSAWRAQLFDAPIGGLSVLSAPSTEPEIRRANTPDTYLFWAERNHLAAGESLLIITASANRPFQHFDALRVFGDRPECRIETVAVESRVRGETPAASSMLQEVLAGLQKADRLVRSLTPS